jgi:phenylalanyl-tRNA synthetase alpha chain
MTNPIQTIKDLTQSALGDINSAATLADLEKVRVAVLGRKGELAGISKTFGTMAPEDRAKAGQLLNEAKATLEKSFEDRKASLEGSESDQRFKAEWIDLTVPPQGIAPGHIHPVTQVQDEIEQLFTSMGFRVLDGPEVETDHYNFDALNIPSDHPARDMQDTFWMTDGHLLRTHTSPVQVRALQKYGAPMRMIAPGRVFRNEEVDASHEHTFYQVEGMMVDRDVSVSHLIYFMQTLLSSIFGRKVTVRLRPGYFPFVEPGFELDIQCLICGGNGCAVCKQSGWVELLPCGLVHPNVISNSGLDPKEWNGFAFGLGLTRLAMMRYAIDDIRLLQSGDLRFLNQF